MLSPMDFDQAHKVFTALVSTVAPIVAIAAIIFHGYTFKKNQTSGIKTLLLNDARKFNFEEPQNNSDKILLRNHLYDYCGKKEACLDLAILCFNSPRPEVAIECFKEVGPLFTYSPNEKKIIRREGSNKKDKLYTYAVNTYFLTFMIFTASFSFSIILAQEIREADIETMNFANGIAFMYLLALTIHATYEVVMNRKKTNSINHIQNKLLTKN